MDAETDREIPTLAPGPALGPAPEAKPLRTLGPLRMIWSAALAYPGRIGIALGALVVTAAATLGVPWGFSRIIDKGFARGSDPATIEHWFVILLGIVAVLAAGTAVRFYAVSWLGVAWSPISGLPCRTICCAWHPAFSRTTAPRKSPAA